MDKKDTIIDYFNGISQYTLMHDYLQNIEDNDKYDFSRVSDDALIYSEAALIANFFFTKKEEMVENKGNLIYESKIFDESLERVVNFISTKKGDKYKIDNYEADAPTLIAVIRNKLAHGDYYVDVLTNSIVINKDNQDMRINITKMINAIGAAIMYLISTKKTSKLERYIVISKANKVFRDKPIKHKEEIVERIKYSRLMHFYFENPTGDILSLDQVECFNKYMHAINVLGDDNNTIRELKINFEKLSKKDGLVFGNTKSKVKNVDTINKIIDYCDSLPDFYQMDSLTQIYLLNSKIIEFECPSYNTESYIYANFCNLKFLEEIIKNKSGFKKDLFKNFDFHSISMYNANINELFMVLEISRFNILFGYPLDTIYAGRDTGLDYSKLDLSFLEPEILKLNTSLLDEEINVVLAAKKQINECEDAYNKELKNYENVKNTNNEKAKVQILKNIQTKRIALENLKSNYYEHVVNMYLIDKDYKCNKKYFINKAIIEGIRNSIAHGNVKITTIDGSSPCKNLLTFTNYYHDDVYFKLTCSLEKFQELFCNNNILTVGNFLYPDSNITILDNDYNFKV